MSTSAIGASFSTSSVRCRSNAVPLASRKSIQTVVSTTIKAEGA